MSAKETKDVDSSTTNEAEKQPKQDTEASEDEEKQMTGRKTGQSRVSTATEESLFSKKKTPPTTPALVSGVEKQHTIM